MFDDITHAEENKDSIMGVMRSVTVCLHILLKNESITGKLNELPKPIKDKGVNIRPAIIDNIHAILFADELSSFRQEFIKSLNTTGNIEEASVFVERLEIARSLPTTTKMQTNKIIGALLAGEQWFVNWLWALMEHEHDYTQEAGISLICDHSSTATGAAHPNNQSVNYYHNEHHHFHHRDVDYKYYYLWGACQPGKETDEELEIINQRIKLIQSFKIGIQDVSGNVWKFKDANDLFSLEETDEILSFSANCPGNGVAQKTSFVVDEPKLNATKAIRKLTKIIVHV